MTHELPSSVSSFHPADLGKYSIRFFQRVIVLLENEGLSLSEYEESHGMSLGAVKAVFTSEDIRAMDRVALSLLREYPKFSYDWLFLGKGQALERESTDIPIIKYPSWLDHQTRILSTADCSEKKQERTILGVTRYFSNLSRLRVDLNRLDKVPDFAIEVQTRDLIPFAPQGSLLVCQRKKTLFGQRWDYNALYVVEEHTELPPEQYSPKQIHFGRLRESDNGIDIEPFPGAIASFEPITVTNDSIASVAQVIGIFRTKFPALL